MTVESILPPTESVVLIVIPVLGIPEYGLKKLPTSNTSSVPLGISVKRGP